MPQRRTLVEALVASAAQDGLGEQVTWVTVQAAIQQLLIDPVGPRDLRHILGKITHRKDISHTLEDWFQRAARAREEDAKSAARAGEKLLAPIQIVSMAGALPWGLGYAFGTITLGIAIPITIGLLIIAAAASAARWKLSRREDEALSDAQAIRRLAQIAEEARR